MTADGTNTSALREAAAQFERATGVTITAAQLAFYRKYIDVAGRPPIRYGQHWTAVAKPPYRR